MTKGNRLKHLGYSLDPYPNYLLLDRELDLAGLGWKEGDIFRIEIFNGQPMFNIVELVNKYGFPIVMAVGLGYIIKYVWEWATREVKPVISDANTVLIALIDRIRMLDNDLIRLNQKVNTVLHLRGKTIEHERVAAEKEINKTVDDREAAGGNG